MQSHLLRSFWHILVLCLLAACEKGSCSVVGAKHGGECGHSEAVCGSAMLQSSQSRAKSIAVVLEDNANEDGDVTASKQKAKYLKDIGVKIIHGIPVYKYHRAQVSGRGRGIELIALPHQPADWMVKVPDSYTDAQLDQFCRSLVGNATCLQEGHPDKSGISYVAIIATQTELDAILKQNPDITFVEADDNVHLIPEVPVNKSDKAFIQLDGGLPWGLDRIDERKPDGNVAYTPPASKGGGVHVYVLDTGVNTQHQEFGNRAIPTLESYDPSKGQKVCSAADKTCAADNHGHGTHCAGTIAGASKGVAAQATIHAVAVLGPDGSGSVSGIVQAIDWIVSNAVKPAVISMSLGGNRGGTMTEVAINKAFQDGIPVVVAAGNENTDACTKSPAYIPKAITVGATDRSDGRASFSNYGSCLDIFAPGVSIEAASHSSNSGFAFMSGTSMACPHVAGAAALLLGQNSNLKPEDVTKILIERATKAQVTGLDGLTGTVNELLFVSSEYPTEAAPTPQPTPSPTPTRTWSVTAGQCVHSMDNCIGSPNYPYDYGESESCTITIASPTDISVTKFNVEEHWDKLIMNGVEYSGVKVPPAGTYTGTITWSSDGAVVAAGWQLCALTTRGDQPAPTSPPTTGDQPAPTPSPVCQPQLMNPPDTSRTFSSVYANNRPGTGYARSMIDSLAAWSAASNDQLQYMYIDLGKVYYVEGFQVQPRADTDQHVAEVKVSISNDTLSWESVGTYTTQQGSLTIHDLPGAARYVEFMPTAWHSWISMRAGVFTCGEVPPAAPTSAPATPAPTPVPPTPIPPTPAPPTPAPPTPAPPTPVPPTPVPPTPVLPTPTPTPVPTVATTTSTLPIATPAPTLKEDCVPMLGNPPEHSRSYSSVYPGGYDQSMLNSSGCWAAAQSVAGEWMVIDLHEAKMVIGVEVQPRAPYSWGFQAVNKFELFLSTDGTSWTSKGEVTTLNGHITKKLASPVRARYVKFWVLEWTDHISMRAGVLLCKTCTSEIVLDPPEKAREYSSSYYDDPIGTGHARSMLSSVQAWSPWSGHDEWMEIELDSEVELIGVKVLPRHDKDWQYVTEFRLQVSTDGVVFHDAGEYQSATGTFSVYIQADRQPVPAKYVKFMPLEWNSHPSMRAGLLVCGK